MVGRPRAILYCNVAVRQARGSESADLSIRPRLPLSALRHWRPGYDPGRGRASLATGDSQPRGCGESFLESSSESSLQSSLEGIVQRLLEGLLHRSFRRSSQRSPHRFAHRSLQGLAHCFFHRLLEDSGRCPAHRSWRRSRQRSQDRVRHRRGELGTVTHQDRRRCQGTQPAIPDAHPPI